MPELGRTGRQQIGALAGLAPYDHNSGKTSKKRFIQSGRTKVRRALYMASLTQTQCDVIAHHLNERPRKRHGYKTPKQCFLYH
jgi:transposase